MWWRKKQKRIYLDYAATTPVRKEVFDAMRPYFSDAFANPSAIYREGVEARKVVEGAREDVARTLRVRAHDVLFTGSGTESNNLAIYGTLRALAEEGTSFTEMEVITTATEHPSVIEVLKHLSTYGLVVHHCPVEEDGRIDLSAFKALLSPKTALVTLAYANSETGVVQDVHKITRVVRAYNTEHEQNTLVHLDAAQAPLWLPCALDALGVDLLTLDAGKCYGPKGVGVLAMRHGVALLGVQLGGGQERGLRAGTENTAGIVGAAKAIVIAQDDWQARSEAVASLRDYGITTLEAIKGVVVNGSKESRLPNNINISIAGIDTEYAVIVLDAHGIACSTKSACSGANGSGSYVVHAMTGDEDRANSTIRFSFGEKTTKAEIDTAIETLKTHIEKTRAFLER